MSDAQRPAWQQEPVVLVIAHALLDRIERGPKARVRTVRLKLNADIMPRLFSGAARDSDYHWSLIERMAQVGWIGLILDRSATAEPGYYRNPRAELLNEAALRVLTGRELSDVPEWHEQFLTALAARLPAGHSALDEAMRLSLPLQGYDASQVAERLLQVRNLAEEPLLLREVASRLFFAQSKALDGRESLIAAILEQPECPFPDMPLQLSVHLPLQPFEGVLFVENSTTFDSLGRRRPASCAVLALIYASGYRCSARRLRMRDGASVHFAAASLPSQAEATRFQEWLTRAGPEVPVAFYGDLDFSGLSILARLRGSFENAVSWRPGYDPMLAILESGGGHPPEAAKKGAQKDPLITGCAYADDVLLPALRRLGRFVDQEVG